MDTFKVICLPLAVLLLAVAVVVPAPSRGRPVGRWALAAVALVLAAIALFVTADSVS